MKALGMKILMPPTQTGHTEGMPLLLCALMKLKLTLLQGLSEYVCKHIHASTCKQPSERHALLDNTIV